jgi:hypothetical protein
MSISAPFPTKRHVPKPPLIAIYSVARRRTRKVGQLSLPCYLGHAVSIIFATVLTHILILSPEPFESTTRSPSDAPALLAFRYASRIALSICFADQPFGKRSFKPLCMTPAPSSVWLRRICTISMPIFFQAGRFHTPIFRFPRPRGILLLFRRSLVLYTWEIADSCFSHASSCHSLSGESWTGPNADSVAGGSFVPRGAGHTRLCLSTEYEYAQPDFGDNDASAWRSDCNSAIVAHS